MRRIVSRITKISGVRLQQKKCTPDEIESAKKAVSLLGEQTKLFLDDMRAFRRLWQLSTVRKRSGCA